MTKRALGLWAFVILLVTAAVGLTVQGCGSDTSDTFKIVGAIE